MNPTLDSAIRLRVVAMWALLGVGLLSFGAWVAGRDGSPAASPRKAATSKTDGRASVLVGRARGLTSWLTAYPRLSNPPRPGFPGHVSDRSYRGRVVSARGAPVSGATVRLIGLPRGQPSTGVNPNPYVVEEVRTNRSGRFRFDAVVVSEFDEYYLAVDAREGDRGVRLGWIAHGDADLGTIRVAPTRALALRVRCRDVPETEASVAVFWGAGRHDEWASYGLRDSVDVGREPPSVVPNFEVHWRGGPMVSAGERPTGPAEVGLDLEVPLGTVGLVLDTSCGYHVEHLQVRRGRGALPALELVLPRPGAASVELVVEGGSSRNPSWISIGDAEVGFHDRWTLRPDRVRTLPPGRYVLGPPDQASCRETLELGPGAHQTLRVRGSSCLLQQSLLHFCGNR